MSSLNRSKTGLRTSVLDTLLLNLKTLALSVHQEVLPEFSSVLKTRPEPLIDPRIFLDEWPEDPVQALPLLKPRASTPGGRLRAGRAPFQVPGKGTKVSLSRITEKPRKLSPTPGPDPQKTTVMRSPSEPMSKAQRRIRLQELAAEQQRAQLLRILEQTGTLDRYKPDYIRQQLREKAARDDFRAVIVRLAKLEICNSRKSKHMEVLQDKLRRHDWRQRAGEISQGKRIWTGLVVYFGTMEIILEKLERRKELHVRSKGILKFLLIMAITVGKIQVKVKRKRYKHAFSVIHRIAPFLMRWRRRHQVKMRERIAVFVETSLSQDVFYKIIASWKARLLCIQRIIRNWIWRRRAHKALLAAQWSRIETLLASKGGKPLDIPPISVKLLLISDLLKEKIKSHLFDLENWRSKCDSILTEHKNLQYELLDEPLKSPKLPQKPKFPTLLAKAEIMQLMAKAEKKKSRWGRITKDIKTKTMRKGTESSDIQG